jgi:hypothetical protein|tara:strand:+ start:186 stop:806 length:621 start_codon:yes stop_codon:yes gene_type:complete
MSIMGILGALAGNALFPGAGMLGGLLGGGLGAIAEEKLFNKDDGNEDAKERLRKLNEGPPTAEDALDNLFKSRFTDPETGISPHFDTAAARDAYDREFMKKHGGQPVLYQGLALGGQAESGIGGLIQGPGTVTSDSIPGGIMQNGEKVEEILVSNGEVILSGKDLAGLDPDGNMERAGMRLGGAANGTRGAEAAKMFAEVQKMKEG